MSESRHNPDQLLKEIQADEENRNKGHLKIFFGYAAGVGKTYAMLEAAHMEKQQGIDVVAGYVETHARPKTAALLNGLEVLPTRKVFYNGMILDEFDIGMALKRKPQLILVDELAHTNAEGCRHAKRYQDIKELLNAGIDVYTTVNVQHIESLCDTVASITEIVVRERIPDSIFDNADQVELIDIEPQDLINRLNTENVYRQTQAKQTVENFFTIENLTALREISLRRCADRVNILTENTRIKNHGDYHTGEHILVCLSSSPSNAPAILEVVSYKFVQEETDVVERVEYPVVVLQHKVNDKDEPLPMIYAWDVEEEENSLFVLTEGSLPVNAENLADLKIPVPFIDAGGKLFIDGTGAKTPLIFGETLKVKNGSRSIGNVKYEIPPYSIYELTKQECGYRCTLTFYLVLKAVNKGEEYHLKGRWTGEQLREQKMGLIDLSDEKGAEKTVLMEAPIELFEKDYETGLD